MKKVGYLVIGLLAGSILSTTAGAVTAQVKSMVGTKVAAEYTVTVDGKKLPDKAAIVDNKAMVPLRAVSDSWGAEIKLDTKNKQINLSTESTSNVKEDLSKTESSAIQTNEFSGQTKSALQNTLKSIDEYQLPPLYEARDRLTAVISQPEDHNEAFISEKQKQLEEYEGFIEDLETKRAQILQAIQAAE